MLQFITSPLYLSLCFCVMKQKIKLYEDLTRGKYWQYFMGKVCLYNANNAWGDLRGPFCTVVYSVVRHFVQRDLDVDVYSAVPRFLFPYKVNDNWQPCHCLWWAMMDHCTDYSISVEWCKFSSFNNTHSSHPMHGTDM